VVCRWVPRTQTTQLNSRPLHLFEGASENTFALVIPENPDRVCLTGGKRTQDKRTQERTASFQTLLNCLDGMGVLVGDTTNDPTCHPVGSAGQDQNRTVPSDIGASKHLMWTRLRGQM
jgi:hypothetical protein